VTEVQLDAVADELNDRPRKRLAFANPTEQLAELLLQ
jgi:IS30 family transposase